ncbi:amidohydrolase family protein [Streptomyces sp. NPDC096152]|uniref:amidohydrolase family protein n=1 Tax=Streptomyces sp. NPDC096152 TaxID=3366078 RepID=UPI003806CBF9
MHLALATATRIPATVFGVDESLGTLHVGKLADFAAVAGNPFEDFNGLIKITTVAVGGEVFEVPKLIDAYGS